MARPVHGRRADATPRSPRTHRAAGQGKLYWTLVDGQSANPVMAVAELAPREMHRAWMTASGNARPDGRDEVKPADLPPAGHGKRARWA